VHVPTPALSVEFPQDGLVPGGPESDHDTEPVGVPAEPDTVALKTNEPPVTTPDALFPTMTDATAVLTCTVSGVGFITPPL
jgi:hypothetical protein